MSLTPATLKSATDGFDHFFAGNIDTAREVFQKNADDPYHQLGLAVCSFLEAAMSMETADAARAESSITESLRLSSQYRQSAQPQRTSRFPTGLEWDVLIADATVLSGLIHIFSETYLGYARCIFTLKSAKAKFTKLFNTVFPNGLDEGSLRVGGSSNQYGLFGLLLGNQDTSKPFEPEGPLEEFIVAGTAFGFGLFNLVLSLLPKGIRQVVGFFGLTFDQRSALRALRVAADKRKNDVHSVFARLVLMLYLSLVLQMTPWQADTEQLRKEFRDLLDPIVARYPSSNLWAVYRAKLMRVSNDHNGAIAALEDGTRPGRPLAFKQADMLVVYELGWTLVGERRYEQAAKLFMQMKEMNQWSHATYHFLAAGKFCCYIAVGKLDEGQRLLDDIPYLDGKKVAGKAPPTEVFLKKKIEFYKEKQQRSGRPEAKYVEFIKIGLAEELGIFWNNHAYISQTAAREHINALSKLTTAPSTDTAESAPPTITDQIEVDLDSPDELAVRSLLLGVLYCRLGDFVTARRHLTEGYRLRSEIKVSTWVSGLTLFEMAVVDLKEMDAVQNALAEDSKGYVPEGTCTWEDALYAADCKLNEALKLSSRSVDLSSRLDSRVAMFKEEIRKKGEVIPGGKVERNALE